MLAELSVAGRPAAVAGVDTPQQRGQKAPGQGQAPPHLDPVHRLF